MKIGLEKFHGLSTSGRKEPLSFALIRQIGGFVVAVIMVVVVSYLYAIVVLGVPLVYIQMEKLLVYMNMTCHVYKKLFEVPFLLLIVLV